MSLFLGLWLCIGLRAGGSGLTASNGLDTVTDFLNPVSDFLNPFVAAQTPLSSPAQPPADWQPITLEKTAEEKAVEARATASGVTPLEFKVRRPLDHDNLTLELGTGYVQGADWGFELGAAGRSRGVAVQFGSLLTQGPRGLLVENGRLTLLDAAFGHALELGDLQSDIWGATRGARFAWKGGSQGWPSLSVYVKSATEGNTETVLALRDEVRPRPWLRVGSELATDGSYLLKQDTLGRLIQTECFYRATAHHTQDGMGAAVTFTPGRFLDLVGTFNRISAMDAEGEQRTLALRFPFRKGGDLTIAHDDTSGLTAHTSRDTLTVQAPLGKLRMMMRYQRTGAQSWPLSNRQLTTQHPFQDLLLAFGYSRSPRATFDYQVNLNRQENGRSDVASQLVGTFHLSKRTRLQISSDSPDIFQTAQIHARLSQVLNRQMTLTVDYGLLSPYQSYEPAEFRRPGYSDPPRGLMLMLRTKWDVPTAARGAEVKGRVVDQAGHPLRAAGIRLGDYRVLTDADGRYQFHFVPAGTYPLGLVESSLPTDYRSDERDRTLQLDERSRRTVDFRVIPLNTVSGRVWLDKNGNGKFDPGEGVGGVVLHLDDSATISEADGTFAFYNVAPGAHTVRLDVSRLLEDYDAASAVETSIDLQADRSISDLAFRLKKKDKEIEFQPLP